MRSIKGPTAGEELWGRGRAGWWRGVGAGLAAALLGLAAPAAADTPRIVDLVSGGLFNCALDDDGQVWCWGRNDRGQLGDGTLINRNRPVAVKGLDDAVAITAGWSHACELRESGRVYCWGNNDRGQLGDDTLERRLEPVRVRRLPNASEELAAGGEHTCVRRTNGRVVCWGAGWTGQMGDGTTTTRLRPGANVRRLPGVMQVVSGYSHSCALRHTGRVACWGNNQWGQIGDDTLIPRDERVHVLGLRNAMQISAGNGHVCAVHGRGRVACWGYN